MPKRSNDFQRLIYLVKQHVGDGATVTESRFLSDRRTGAPREVDVCIEATVAGHPLIVSIECVAHKRTADVTWVDKMIGKHQRLPTSRLVLVSESGFTEEAKAVARVEGIETLVLESVTEHEVEQLFVNIDSLWTKIFTLVVTHVSIGVAATGHLTAETVSALPGNTLYLSNGTEQGSVQELVEMMLHAQPIVEELGKFGDETHKGFELG